MQGKTEQYPRAEELWFYAKSNNGNTLPMCDLALPLPLDQEYTMPVHWRVRRDPAGMQKPPGGSFDSATRPAVALPARSLSNTPSPTSLRGLIPSLLARWG